MLSTTEEGEHGEGGGGGAAVVYFVSVDEAEQPGGPREGGGEENAREGGVDFSIVLGREVGCLVLVSESFVAIRLSRRGQR